VGRVRWIPNIGTPCPILVRMVRMSLSLVQCLTEHKALKACGGNGSRGPRVIMHGDGQRGQFPAPLAIRVIQGGARYSVK
jgi:hypothetical protein